MSDYAKKKNDELAALCKERGLPHTGKKADLVKRLEDHDSSAGKDAAVEEAPAAAENGNSKQPAPTSGAPAVDTAAPMKNSEAAPSTTEDKPEAQDFSLGLSERTLDEEIEKRKKRAAKFGLDIKDDETLKQLERAKRFGNTNLPGLLNQALPERGERQKKRGREGRDEKEDRKRSRQRAPEDGKRAAESKKPSESKKDGTPGWMTASDREAAEKRKARFGAAQ